MNIKSKLKIKKKKKGETYFTNRDYMPEVLASFKKSLYDKTEGISSDIKLGVDQDLYFKVEEMGPVYVLDEFTYLYRTHKNNISHIKTEVTLYWNLVVRHRTCSRRGLDPNEYTIKDFVRYMERYENVLKSHSYRLGNFLLSPFILLKRLIKKSK